MERAVDNIKEAQWAKLLCSTRRKKGKPVAREAGEHRTEIERDHDRILFSTPVRRLADKTQVFPLEKNDSVRNRLTHSHEVSNLARSVGTALVFEHKIAAAIRDAQRDIPALCAAIGLAHDLGNPPFGHQGESAIQSWFKEHEATVLGPLKDKQQIEDFRRFEGNAQGFRLVTQLQLLNDDFGLDLTYATLAALMKYPNQSNNIDKGSAARKKHNFFATEQRIAETVLEGTGLALGRRHPLAYVMEACDDIAYVVLDIEDAVKKKLASFSDVIAHLEHTACGDELIAEVISESREHHKEYRASKFSLSASELNDVSMQRFRVAAMGRMIRAVTQAFVDHEQQLIVGDATKNLLEFSRANALRDSLKDFGLKHAYRDRSVLTVELQGYNVIRNLMDNLWAAIVDRQDSADPASPRRHPFTRFVYERISENYRRVFEQPPQADEKIPLRYRECLLLTDMISGMTDSYAMDLCDVLQKLRGEFSLSNVLQGAA